jgi:RNA polymerase sigma factor (sigma-70 family)
MPNALSATVARMGRALYPTDLTDGQLVGRFVAARDGDAFAALVRRHGPMVLAVCRRVAGEHHLAEDAFQAAFLVLARRAADVRPREAVRAWLYGVAVRTAREARAMSARRREVPVAAVPDRPAAAEPRAGADELRALDEELARLPDHLRAAVVLCELDGASRKDAAARLGIPEGTLSSRLAKARKLLAARLRGRGVALPAGLAALLGRATDAAVPAALSDAACGLTASTCVPAAVAELSRGVFRIMLLKKLKAVPVLLTLLGVGLGLAWSGGPTSAPAAPPPAAHAPDSAIWLYETNSGRLTMISQAGIKVRELTLPDGKLLKGFTDKGRRLWFAGKDGRLPTDSQAVHTDLTLHVRDLSDKGIGTDLGIPVTRGSDPVFSPDGKRAILHEREPNGKAGEPAAIRNTIVENATRKKTRLDLPADHRVMDWSPDGKWLLTVQEHNGVPAYRLFKVPVAGGKPELLTGTYSILSGRVSPDGTKVVCVGDTLLKRKEAWPFDDGVFVVDLATRKMTRIASHPHGISFGAFWSPDGKRITYVVDRLEQSKSNAKYFDWVAPARLIVCDADGKNAATIWKVDDNKAVKSGIGVVGWWPTGAPDSPKPPARKSSRAAPKPKGPNRLLVAKDNKLVLLDPNKQPGEGAEERVGPGLFGTLSPDGKWLAIEEWPEGPLPKDKLPPRRPVVRRLDRKGDAVVIPKLDPAAPEPPCVRFWSADGSRLLVEQPLTPARSDGWHEKVSWWLFDPTTGKAERVPVSVPAWHTVIDISPDGQTFLTHHYAIRPGKPTVIRLALVTRSGGKPEFITPADRDAYLGRFSPDGKRLLYIGAGEVERAGQRYQLSVMDLATRKSVRISDPEKGDLCPSCSWSPDGKRVAYVRRKMFYPPDPKAGGDPGCNFTVVVADADGKNPKVVAARTVIDKHVRSMSGLVVCDWR